MTRPEGVTNGRSTVAGVVPPVQVAFTADEPQLTPRQREVLLHCVSRGYYEIPRPCTLRMLAQELGISAPSLSVILRRAEGKLAIEFARAEGVVFPPGGSAIGSHAARSPMPTG